MTQGETLAHVHETVPILWLRLVWLWPSALHIHRKMIPKLLGNPVSIDLLGLQLFSTFLQKSSYCSFEIATKICFAWFDLVCQRA